MQDQFLQAFKDVVRDQLIQRNKVYIEDLGTFKPVHLTQRKWEYKDGKVVLLPPKDHLEFEADFEGKDENES
jgi:nucleoid DNA-binding protein